MGGSVLAVHRLCEDMVTLLPDQPTYRYLFNHYQPALGGQLRYSSRNITILTTKQITGRVCFLSLGAVVLFPLPLQELRRLGKNLSLLQ